MKCLEKASQIAESLYGVRKSAETNESVIPEQILLFYTPPPSSSPTKNQADKETKDRNHYPHTELQWLAATSFNNAVDFYQQGDDERCKVWAEKAFSVANFIGDQGAMRDMLMKRYSGLTWTRQT